MKKILKKWSVIIVWLWCMLGWLAAQELPTTFKNPILAGFHPDPSICRVGMIIIW
ncbi:hypothetical protein [Saccharicrinis fermentans]|uniref:Uncharacterized protein n=1 Tax=Saccharicrinis fermentans DSM 9555 = JCM 21142 TaxID=869213 RepID=W7YN16_9BACT|nr:hypothetical protein [Saccharicrinis fermentans]GAF03789.1 hypothetical protein JCM21142_62471 [Saccharicrinis fermentans DSM 9555 = JCM 21142]